ncbi:hypothetical protein THRCLA_08159 [Thraustotheca clavata]|uniref:PH domain-containing protein n=1 Tax=Thraustotheca clavata TaxID=74557 RepID=A0A1V9Z944_9STRA|nr:hypothetical protein THRCLA_08159 [Thraustotheca clavata]
MSGSSSGETDTSGGSVRRHSISVPCATSTSGWLRLRCGFFRSWKVHYFVLKGTELTAYTTSHYERQPFKQRLSVVLVEKSLKYEHGFIVSSMSGTAMTLTATCERDYTKWINAFSAMGSSNGLDVAPVEHVQERRGSTSNCTRDRGSTLVESEVYLYIPTKSIPLTTSDTALDEARAAIAKLQATVGDHVPTRSTLDDPLVEWRVGRPDYSMLDLLFLQGKTHNHKPGSLEWMIQNLIKTWEMEINHKSNMHQWTTINSKLFQCHVNTNEPFSSEDLLHMGKYDTFLSSATSKYDTKKSTRERSSMMFGSAFPNGFAWEVLEVFSKPPRVSFSWRHWGYPKGTSSTTMIELFGFTILDLDTSMRICGMETFYKADAFLEVLEKQNLLRKSEDQRASSLCSRSSTLFDSDGTPDRDSIVLDTKEPSTKCPFTPIVLTSPSSFKIHSIVTDERTDDGVAMKCPFATKFT